MLRDLQQVEDFRLRLRSPLRVAASAILAFDFTFCYIKRSDISRLSGIEPDSILMISNIIAFRTIWMALNRNGSNDVSTELDSDSPGLPVHTYQDLSDTSLVVTQPDLPGLQNPGDSDLDSYDRRMWRSIGLCGAICAVGILGINRYARSPARQFYGRLGLSFFFTAWSFDRMAVLDNCRATQTRMKDPDLRWALRTADAFWNSTMDLPPGFVEEICLPYYENVRCTNEEKELREQESFRHVWVLDEYRALASLTFRSQLEEYQVSTHDIHKFLYLAGALTSRHFQEVVRERLLMIGGVMTAVGVLAPWPRVVAATFYGGIFCLANWSIFGPVRWYSIVRCINSFEDKARIREALEASNGGRNLKADPLFAILKKPVGAPKDHDSSSE